MLPVRLPLPVVVRLWRLLLLPVRRLLRPLRWLLLLLLVPPLLLLLCWLLLLLPVWWRSWTA